MTQRQRPARPRRPPEAVRIQPLYYNWRELQLGSGSTRKLAAEYGGYLLERRGRRTSVRSPDAIEVDLTAPLEQVLRRGGIDSEDAELFRDRFGLGRVPWTTGELHKREHPLSPARIQGRTDGVLAAMAATLDPRPLPSTCPDEALRSPTMGKVVDAWHRALASQLNDFAFSKDAQRGLQLKWAFNRAHGRWRPCAAGEQLRRGLLVVGEELGLHAKQPNEDPGSDPRWIRHRARKAAQVVLATELQYVLQLVGRSNRGIATKDATTPLVIVEGQTAAVLAENALPSTMDLRALLRAGQHALRDDDPNVWIMVPVLVDVARREVPRPDDPVRLEAMATAAAAGRVAVDPVSIDWASSVTHQLRRSNNLQLRVDNAVNEAIARIESGSLDDFRPEAVLTDTFSALTSLRDSVDPQEFLRLSQMLQQALGSVQEHRARRALLLARQPGNQQLTYQAIRCLERTAKSWGAAIEITDAMSGSPLQLGGGGDPEIARLAGTPRALAELAMLISEAQELNDCPDAIRDYLAELVVRIGHRPPRRSSHVLDVAGQLLDVDEARMTQLAPEQEIQFRTAQARLAVCAGSESDFEVVWRRVGRLVSGTSAFATTRPLAPIITAATQRFGRPWPDPKRRRSGSHLPPMNALQGTAA